MIEQAPHIEKTDQTISLMVKYQMSGILRKVQDEYLYWDKIKYKSKDCTPLELWSAVKLDRWLKSKKVSFHTYDFHFVITDYIQKSLHHFDMHIGGTLGSNIDIAETDKTKFILSSIMEEAISSSQMEGANTTRKKAKEMIRQEKKPKNKSEQMILNNFITMKYIAQHKSEELTVDSLLYIHKLISNDTLDNANDEGKFRENGDVRIVNHSNGEIVHIPPLKSNLKI